MSKYDDVRMCMASDLEELEKLRKFYEDVKEALDSCSKHELCDKIADLINALENRTNS